MAGAKSSVGFPEAAGRDGRDGRDGIDMTNEKGYWDVLSNWVISPLQK